MASARMSLGVAVVAPALGEGLQQRVVADDAPGGEVEWLAQVRVANRRQPWPGAH